MTRTTVTHSIGACLAGVAAAACLTVGATGASAATATPAATPTTPAVDTQLRERLELACARVPNALTRTENLQARLAGDATTPGSLLWLEEAATRARANGREELATALENRLVVRTELVDLLPQRLVRLQEAQVACGEAGL